jgi:hypothetical protein
MTWEVSVKIETCETCSGSGAAPHPDAGAPRECWICHGFGWASPRGTRYKSLAAARRNGRLCKTCDGTGVTVWPDTTPCYDCSHSGVIVLDAHVGEVLPDSVGRCDHLPGAVAATLAAEWDIVAVREDRGQSWGESYLGLGSIWSCTDYGRSWAADDSVTLRHVRAELAERGTQWLNVLDPGRRILPTIVVKITRNGYSVVGADREAAHRASLPPTYTAAVLDREV